MKPDFYAIIVGGGSGSRMGSEIPKQFLPLHDTPVIIHTLKKFINAMPGLQLIVVIPGKELNVFEKIIQKFLPKNKIIVITGGDTRFLSVKNGLELVPDKQGVVAIHDAVRPLLSSNLIKNCFKVALENGSAIPVIPPTDSLRKLNSDYSVSVDRQNYRIVQTPQCFQIPLIKAAYRQPHNEQFTDDATVFETSGKNVFLITGEEENIKITTPKDLLIAEYILSAKPLKD